MISLFGRFDTPICDQLIDHADPFGHQAPNELLNLCNRCIARANPKLTIDHFHHDGIADLKPHFASKAGRDDEFAAIDDLS